MDRGVAGDARRRPGIHPVGVSVLGCCPLAGWHVFQVVGGDMTPWGYRGGIGRSAT